MRGRREGGGGGGNTIHTKKGRMDAVVLVDECQKARKRKRKMIRVPKVQVYCDNNRHIRPTHTATAAFNALTAARYTLLVVVLPIPIFLITVQYALFLVTVAAAPPVAKVQVKLSQRRKGREGGRKRRPARSKHPFRIWYFRGMIP